MAGIRQQELWDAFVVWCQARGLKAMPANAWTLAAYLRYLEGRTTPSGMLKVVRAIGRLHREKSRKRPDRHPLVTRTMRLIEQRRRERRQSRQAPTALFAEEDFVSPSPPPAVKAVKAPASTVAKAPRKSLRVTPRLVRRRKLPR